MRFGALVVLLAIAVLSGCSSSSSACRVPVDQLGCAATFDQQVQQSMSAYPSICALAGPCGSHLVWRIPPSYTSAICIYDDSGQQLLSATGCSDVPLACGDFCMTGGQSLDVARDCDLSALPRRCASGDGGQDSD